MANYSRSDFYPNLEATRGIAALMVALFHIGLTPYVDAMGHQQRLIARPGDFSLIETISRILGNGPGAVIFFFVLSGFVLTKVLANGPSNAGKNCWQFLTGRIFRLYPAVLSTLAIFYAIFLVSGHSLTGADQFKPTSLLLNALLIRPTIDSVMWSLQLEMIAAPMLLLIYFAWLHFGARAVLLPYALLLILSFTAVWNHLIGSPNSFGQIYAFLAGMTAFLYGPKIVRDLKRPRLWLVIALIGFALSRPIIGWSSYWTIWLETIFGSAIVALLAFGPFGSLSSPALRAIRFLGKISFSFYLLSPIMLLPQHYGISEYLASAVDAGAHPLLLCAGLFVCAVAFTTLLAWLQSKVVEQPGMRAGRRFQSKPSKTPQARPEMVREPA
jgi:peptidoglycan/LPS O-acetylase OafA/YrhL